MKNTIKVGSIESSDILIEIHQNQGSLYITNLVPEFEMEELNRFIKDNMQDFDPKGKKISIIYNGANAWTIRSRFEALSNTLLV